MRSWAFLVAKKYVLIGMSCCCFVGLHAQSEPIQLVGEAQGTSYHILYYDSLNRDFYQEVRTLLTDFDASLSTYVPSSLISRINRNEGNPVVDVYFETCFRKAKEIWLSTHGAFDPTVYSLVNAWGFGPGLKHIPDSLEMDSLLTFVGFDLIELQEGYVVKADPRVALDFNAFAQGYSVDVVADFFNHHGIDAYLIEIGGEVYAKGMQESGDDWLVGIEKPIVGETSLNPLQMIVRLENRAVATSGNYRKFMEENGTKYTHQIDPKTGCPAKNSLLSVTVFAGDCLSADAYATGLSIMGLEKAKVFLDAHSELEALLIYADADGTFQVYQTPLLESIIVEE